MEVVSALLRIAARVAGASVALVARDGTDVALASWGVEASAADVLLRVVRRSAAGGAWSFRSCPLALADGAAAELVLISMSSEPDEAALEALAAEIGAALDPAASIESRDTAMERLAESVERLGDAIAIVGARGTREEAPDILHVNAGFTALFGYAPREVVGKPATVLWGPQTDHDRMAWLRSRLVEGDPARVAIVLHTKDGLPLWTEISTTPVRHGAAVDHVVTFRDVTSRRQFEDALTAEKRKLQTTLAAIADAVVTVLPDGRVEFVNAAAQRLLGIDLIDAYGACVEEVVPLLDDDGRVIRVAGAGAAAGVVRGHGCIHARSGDLIDVAYVASPIDAEQRGTVVVLRDVTDEKRRAMRLSFEALHDPLTGLPNRRAFTERLEEAIFGARERGEHHAVGFLDLDRFKVVNDRFGHALGDRLLNEVAKVMAAVIRGGDVLARIGGDEFGLLLANCRIDDARRVAEKIRAAVGAYGLEHGGHVLRVGVSVGLAPIEADVAGAGQALSDADAACYQAKAAGRNAVAG